MAILDWSGRQFGRLIVISLSHRDERSNGYWLCRCMCSKLVTVQASHLRSGNTVSCGCFTQDRVYKHGMNCKGNTHPVYRAWSHMISRCYNPNVHNYHRYGGRGIKVCDRWREDFVNFFQDMGPRPSDKHSLDRIDPNGDYEPSNCRWATLEQQSRNRRDVGWIEYRGEVKTLVEWAQQFGLKYSTLRHRINHGWDLEKALNYSSSIGNQKFVEFNGRTQSLSEWAAEHKISLGTLSYRLQSGWSFEKALKTPVRQRTRCSRGVS